MSRPVAWGVFLSFLSFSPSLIASTAALLPCLFRGGLASATELSWGLASFPYFILFLFLSILDLLVLPSNFRNEISVPRPDKQWLHAFAWRSARRKRRHREAFQCFSLSLSPRSVLRPPGRGASPTSIAIISWLPAHAHLQATPRDPVRLRCVRHCREPPTRFSDQPSLALGSGSICHLAPQ